MDHLVYRGVFDLLNPSENLLNARTKVNKAGEIVPDVAHTSDHVLAFMGWSAGNERRKPQYLGGPVTGFGLVLDQRAAWMQLWLQKGRTERERLDQREAEKASVSA